MEDITETIISEIAEDEGVDPLELEHLYTSIDTDALQALYNRSNGVIRVEFEYSGYKVSIQDEGQVHIEPI